MEHAPRRFTSAADAAQVIFGGFGQNKAGLHVPSDAVDDGGRDPDGLVRRIITVQQWMHLVRASQAVKTLDYIGFFLACARCNCNMQPEIEGDHKGRGRRMKCKCTRVYVR